MIHLEILNKIPYRAGYLYMNSSAELHFLT